MAMEYFKGKVKENIELVEGIYSLVVEHEAKINAGQFYMIKTPNTFLGRPISVCEVNGNDVRFVYATVGTGTNEMKKMISGDEQRLWKSCLSKWRYRNSSNARTCKKP